MHSLLAALVKNSLNSVKDFELFWVYDYNFKRKDR